MNRKLEVDTCTAQQFSVRLTMDSGLILQLTLEASHPELQLHELKSAIEVDEHAMRYLVISVAEIIEEGWEA